MRRFLQIIAAGLFAALATAAGAAQIDASKMAAAKKAADEFLVLAKGSETSGRMPRQSDPKAGHLLHQIFDRAAFGPQAVPLSESDKIGELLNNANRVGYAYMLAGTGHTDLMKIGENQAAIEKAERNMSEFAPEIGRWFDYQIAVQGAIVDATLAFLPTVPKEALERPQVKEGLGNIRNGVARSLSGVLQTMSSDGLDDNWRRARLAMLAEIAPKAAKIIAPNDSATLRSQANALANAVNDESLKAGLKKFGDTIASGAKP